MQSLTTAVESVAQSSGNTSAEANAADGQVTNTNIASATDPPSDVPQSASIHLGTDRSNDELVQWTVSRAANPHLMIVGFLRMGKTEAVMNICRQLMAQAITPNVFSYHPDIDERLSSQLPDVHPSGRSPCCHFTTSIRRCSGAARKDGSLMPLFSTKPTAPARCDCVLVQRND